MALSTSGSVMLRASAHLNDANQLVYNSTILLPYFNMAVDELQEELGVHAIVEMDKSSIIILVDPNDVVLDQLPLDFMEAIRLIERSRGSQDSWREITEVRAIDPNLKSTTIDQWTERSSSILINSPSTGREVMLEYLASMTIAEGEDGPINIETSRRLLALLTARNAARDAGNSASKANTYESDISRARDRLVRRLQNKSQTIMGVRRMPFTGR